MAFRLRSKNFFLTYADADFDNTWLCDTIRLKVTKFNPIYIVVSREFHKYPENHEFAGQEDLNRPHHHVLIVLERELDIKNARKFYR